MNYNNFNVKEVKKAMIDKELSYSKLAKQLKISKGYVCDIVNNKRQGGIYVRKIKEILELE